VVSAAPGTESEQTLAPSRPMTALIGFGQLSILYHVLNPFSVPPCGALWLIQQGRVSPAAPGRSAKTNTPAA